MATPPESGSAGGFFLLEGSCFSPQSPRARSGLDWREVSIQSVGFLSEATLINRICMYDLDSFGIE